MQALHRQPSLRKSPNARQMPAALVVDQPEISDTSKTSRTARARSPDAMAAAFIRSAEPRVAEILTRMQRLRSLADKTRFRWSEQQIAQIETALFDGLTELISSFRTGKGTQAVFRFSDAGE